MESPFNFTIYNHKNHFLDPIKEKKTACFYNQPIISKIRLMCESAIIQRELHLRKFYLDSDFVLKICDLAHRIIPGTFVNIKRHALVKDWDRGRNKTLSMNFPLYMEAGDRDVKVFISLPIIIEQTRRSTIRSAFSILFKDISPEYVDIEVNSAIKQSSGLDASINRINVMEGVKGCPYILEAKSWGTTLKKSGLKMHLFARRLQGDLVDFFNLFDRNSYPTAIQYRNTIKVAYDLARAFKHLHAKGYIHKDVKPDNILINWWLAQQGPVILHSLLADFDLSAPLDDEENRLKSSGTLSYMSPEMVLWVSQDNLPIELCSLFNVYTEKSLEDLITTKMDQWGLWCILFLMKTGDYPECIKILSEIHTLKHKRVKIKKSLCLDAYNEEDPRILRLKEIATLKKKLFRDWEQSIIRLHAEEIFLDWDQNFLNTLLWHLSRPHPQDRIDDDELLRRIATESAKISVL